jgi:4-hydroxy-3-methylbut-2-enyl diphosphate reductase
MAVKSLASRVDLWLVIGDDSSSNSNRLREIGESTGVPAYLVLDEKRIKPEWLVDVETVGITSGASTPEVSVRSVVDRLRELGATTVEEVEGVLEAIEFQLPVEVR